MRVFLRVTSVKTWNLSFLLLSLSLEAYNFLTYALDSRSSKVYYSCFCLLVNLLSAVCAVSWCHSFWGALYSKKGVTPPEWGNETTCQDEMKVSRVCGPPCESRRCDVIVTTQSIVRPCLWTSSFCLRGCDCEGMGFNLNEGIMTVPTVVSMLCSYQMPSCAG